MRFTTRFIETKSRSIHWLYYLTFALCLLIATPLVAMAFISEICVYIDNAIIQLASDKLEIDFTL
jgi:hypothetical protein